MKAMKESVGKKNRLLVVFTDNKLLPVTMMSQNRTINMMKRLAADFEVDLLLSDVNDKRLIISELPFLRKAIFYSHHKNFKFLEKKIFYFKILMMAFLLPVTNVYFTILNNSLKQELKNLEAKGYYAVLFHYWYANKIYSKISINKIVDTHGLLYIKRMYKAEQQNTAFKRFYGKIKATIFKKLELGALKSADIVVFNSLIDEKIYKQIEPNKKTITITNGQELVQSLSLSSKSSFKKRILFYGSMGGDQNIIAFKRFWNNIYPEIKKQIPKVKLLVLGANPPDWIKALENEDVEITGYVDDVKPYINSCDVCILPLTIGSGFRGRVLEVMALGVPVVGIDGQMIVGFDKEKISKLLNI